MINHIAKIVVVPALVVLAGCGAAATEAVQEAAVPAATSIRRAEPYGVYVGLDEYRIAISDTTPAGATFFDVQNLGFETHTLRIEGPNVEGELATALEPKQNGSFELDLPPGTYEVFCPVRDHARRGMRVQLVVTE